MRNNFVQHTLYEVIREVCREKADSLLALVKKGEDFALLAVMNSEDPGSKSQGGDLGWFTDGMMVKEFNEACFTNKPGDVIIAETQFGVRNNFVQHTLYEVIRAPKMFLKRNDL